jgi:hypothetical protein
LKTIRFIIVALLSTMILQSCSRQVIKQTVREIERPIFLPQHNWQFSSGLQINKPIRGECRVSRFAFYLVDQTDCSPILNIQWPSFHFGDNIEFKLPLTLRAYLKKNVVIEDSIERIGGTNIALVSGNTPLLFRVDNMLFSPSLYSTIMIKKPVSNRVWLESNPGLYFCFPYDFEIKYDHKWDLYIPFTAGYQLTDRFSTKLSIALNGSYAFIKSDPNSIFYDKKWDNTYGVYDLDINVPLTFKYVFNKKLEMTAIVSGYFYDTKSIYFSGATWLSCTW